MAEIVLGLASPHAFGGGSPEDRLALRQKDETDRRMDYAALLARASPALAEELVDERMQARYDASQAGVHALGKILEQAAPDVLVVVGDDQKEQFQDDNMPMFCVYRGESVPTARRSTGARTRTGSRAWNSPLWERLREEREANDRTPPEQPAARELAEHLIRFLVDHDFDVACSDRMNPEVGLGHAFTFVYRKLLPNTSVPMLPFMVNTFFPPNQPSPRRCYALGRALRAGIDTWEFPQRVAILASGGLSHVVIDEELDRMLLDAMLEKDHDGLCSLPVERMNLGTSEIRNWIIVAGAMEPIDMTLITEYMPMYRTPAGTGNGCAIGYWS